MPVHKISAVLPRETTSESIESEISGMVKSFNMLGKSLVKIEKEVLYGYAIVSVAVRIYWVPTINRRAICDSLDRVNKLVMANNI